jgi:signal transduction histidine kinase
MLLSRLCILEKKPIRTVLITLVSIFLISCGSKENGRVRFAVESDEIHPASEVWKKFNEIPLDGTGIFNPGITSHLWWMKVELQATKNEPDIYFFKLNNPHINRLDIYVDGSDTATWILGDNFPFSQRPFLNRDFVIPINLAAYESKILLISIDKIGETLMVEPELYTEDEFLQMSASENLFMGLIIGGMAIIFFSACFFAFNLKEISAFIYGILIFSSGFWVFSHWGLGFQFLWPDNLDWADKVRPMFNMITNILFLILVISFFPPLKKNSKLIYSMYFVIGFNLFVVINLALFPLSYFPLDLRILFLRLIFVFSGFMTFLIVLYLIQQKRAKIPFAGYYLIGISVLIVILVLMQFHQSGISLGVPNSVFDFSSSVAILSQTIFITAAFSGRAATYKKEKEQLALEMLVQEKKVADQLIQVQEEERSRLARDLHDSIGGMLSSIYLQADKIEKQVEASEETSHLKHLIKQSIEEARGLSHNLTPPHLDELGLEKTLHNLIESVTKYNDIKVKYFFNVTVPLKKPVELMLYRICSELLYNVIKHANAREVSVQLTSDDNTLIITLEDDGIGMDPQKKINGIGLKNIKDRVNYLSGNLHIDSNAHGTTVIIEAPIETS